MLKTCRKLFRFVFGCKSNTIFWIDKIFFKKNVKKLLLSKKIQIYCVLHSVLHDTFVQSTFFTLITFSHKKICSSFAIILIYNI